MFGHLKMPLLVRLPTSAELGANGFEAAHSLSADSTGPMPVVAESARRASPVSTGRLRNDSIIARVAGAHRAQMTGWGNVVRAVSSKVLPTF